jgi:hypothetical protein
LEVEDVMEPLALDTLRASAFTEQLGASFTLESAELSAIPLTLASCIEHPRATIRGAPRTAFCLIFERAADGAPRAGGLFTLVHPALGRIGPLYVERVLPGGSAVGRNSAAFQIVFN